MIETSNLTRVFGTQPAVEDLTLKVEEGEVFGFLGPNGAGKTTTVRMLSCLISKTSGDAQVAGLDIGRPSEAMEIRRRVGVLPEEVGLYESLSAFKNLDFYGKMYDCPDGARKERIEGLLKALGLWDRKDSPLTSFSKGMKQKVAIARALVHDPKVVFLDEPTANLDPEASRTIREFILRLKEEKRTVFLNTHNLDEAERVCDRVGILKTRLLGMGNLDSLRRSVRSRRTLVRLLPAGGGLVAALERLGYRVVESDATSLAVEIEDPERDNPQIVAALVAAGARVVSVSEISPALEDVYLKLVRGEGPA